MRHRCETCSTVDGHEPDCPENKAPDELPEGLFEQDGKIMFSCEVCDHATELPVDVADYDPDGINMCGGSPRCCP